MAENRELTIARQCNTWAKDNLGEDFKFRDSQLDCIVRIIENVLDSVKTTVAEAPTGTGKSLIGFVAAGVLDTYYDKSTYILCSDTALFKQYEYDIQKYGLNFGHCMGKDNYLCQKNGLPFSSSRCQMQSISLKKLSLGEIDSPEWQCARTCKFLKDRTKSHKAHVSVLTYQLWFSLAEAGQMDDFEYSDFYKMRDLVICDEAHKLPDIVQSMFSPKIDVEQMYHLVALAEYGNDEGIDVPGVEYFKKVFGYMKQASTMDYGEDDSQRNKDLFMLLKKYKNFMDDLKKSSDLLAEKLKNGEKSSKNKDLYKFTKSATQFRQDWMVMDEYIKLINELGIDYMVPNLITDPETNEVHAIVYNCAKESDMVKKFFHERTSHEFLMSATIGDLDNYRVMIASDKEERFDAVEVNNNWDYSRSPIFYNTKYRLSYREKDQNLPYVFEQIESICKKFNGKHGIIQTGSYEFSKKLWNNASPELKKRLIFYNNATERKRAIQNFESYYGKILIGPSLLEGLDFGDDKCRFIIVMKVPYASLADKLVKSKMNLYPTWYQNDVVNKMVQGIGRGVRNEYDWCETYILDGCWNDIVTRSNKIIPNRIKERLKPM